MKEFVGSILAIFFICLYYGGCALVLKNKLIINTVKKITRKQWIFAVSVIILTALFLYYVLLQNNGVYYWDYGGYWTMSVRMTSTIFSHPKQALIKLYNSIQYDDYGYLACMFIVLPLRLIGNSYVSYCMINFFMFLVPAFFMIWIIIMALLDTSKEKSYLFFLIFSSNIFVLRALLEGFIDVVILLPMSILFFYLIMMDFEEKIRLKDVYIGTLLSLILILRRYTAFYILAYGCVMIVVALGNIKVWLIDKVLRKRVILRFLLIGGVFFGSILLLFPKLLFRVLFVNYGLLYEAQAIPFAQQLQLVYLPALVVFLPGFWLIRKKIANSKIIIITQLLIFITVASFFMFKEWETSITCLLLFN